MPDGVLRRYIKDYIQSHSGDQVDFAAKVVNNVCRISFLKKWSNTKSNLLTARQLPIVYKPMRLPLIANGHNSLLITTFY